MTEELDFNFEAPDLRGLFQQLKEFDPKLATAVRRELREAGDGVIAEQRAILAGSKPGSIRQTGNEFRLVVPRSGRKPYIAKRAVFVLSAEKSSGVSNLRSQIARGLRTRVTAGKTRQSIEVKSTGPRNDGYNMAVVWNKARFRHPVFGHGFVWQQGQPYFWKPTTNAGDQVSKRMTTIIEDALQRLAQ